MAWWWLLVQLVTWVLAGAVALLWWLWITRPRVDAPGPPTLPIIGNILDLRDVPLTTRKLRDFHCQYGDLTRFYVGPVLVLMVAHPDDVQQILLLSRQTDRDPFFTRAMRVFVGDGLLTLNGQDWKVHRKLINPTFHSQLLEGFLEAFHEGGLYLSERLASTRGVATDVHPVALVAALRNICNTVIGVDPDLMIPHALVEEEASAAMRAAMTTVMKMLVQPWMQSKFLLRLTGAGRMVFKYMELVRDGARQCIAMRSAATEEGPANTRLRLLEALVKPGGQTEMPLSEVEEEMVNMAIAGTETTAVSMAFLLAVLALHPEWQDAVREELREVFGEGDDYLRAAKMEDLSRLRVLDSVIKEMLRLFPVVPLINRVASKDIWLSRGRVLVPKGSRLMVVPFVTHRMPEFFPDPERFDPSRFLEDRVGKEHACSYVPFGLGARSCVGSQYARLQLKVFLGDILRRFRILPHCSWQDLEDTELSISLQSIKPLRVSCVPLQDPRHGNTPNTAEDQPAEHPEVHLIPAALLQDDVEVNTFPESYHQAANGDSAWLRHCYTLSSSSQYPEMLQIPAL